MSFKPVPMEKVRIIAIKSKAQDLLSAIHDLGSVQLEDVTEDFRKDMNSSTELYRKNEIIELLNVFRGMEALLPRKDVKEKVKFSDVDELIARANNMRIQEDIKIAMDSIGDLKSEIKNIDNRLEVLNFLKPLDADVSYFNNSVVSSYIIRDQTEIPENEEYIRNFTGTATIVTMPKELEKEFAQKMGTEPGKVIHVMEMHGKPDDLIHNLEALKSGAELKIKELEMGLDELSNRHYAELVSIREALEIEAKKIEVAMKMPSSRSIFVLEGWVPKREHQKLKSTTENVTGGLCIMEDIQTDEEPPTLQQTPRRFKLFESFIRFYSLPQGTEIDPTLIFAIIFPIFFGIMVGDWGFGLFILIFALWLNKRINSTGPKRKLPKKLTGFVTSIFSPYQLQILARAMLPGAVVAIIAGVIFNGFFGFKILPTQIGSLHITYFDPIVYTSKLLLITGYFGVFMVSFGFILGIINDYYHNHKKMIIGHIGWLLFVWGIVIMGLSLIYKLDLSPSTNIFAAVDYGAIVLGVILIVMIEKGIGLIELPSVISHILSYLRIMGILLASVILTELVNQFFLSSLKDPVLLVFGVIILIIGQLFALLLAIVESGIQGVRLLYVEFFSKFYKGNGKPFSPFRTDRKYTEENSIGKN